MSVSVVEWVQSCSPRLPRRVLCCLPLSPPVLQAKKRPPAVALSFDPLSSFTPANADPARRRVRRHERFADRFQVHSGSRQEPSVAGPRRDSRPGATAGSGSPTRMPRHSAVSALTPATYNLGVAVGWRRFAVSGDVAKVKDADPALGGRESAVVGVSYSLKRFTGAGRGRRRARRGRPLRRCARATIIRSTSAASYSLSRRIALTGGVRYNIERDRMPALKDDRRDSQAVYVGTAFKF